MKSLRQWLVGALVIFCAVGWLVGAARSETLSRTISGTVERVIDGDTFVLNGERIRIWGVDAPEIPTPAGLEAKAALGELLANTTVTCRDWGRRSYDRVVAVCRTWIHDIATWLVQSGLARDWPAYSGGAYAAEEKRARLAGLGMWR